MECHRGLLSPPPGSGVSRGTWVCVHVFIRTRVCVCVGWGSVFAVGRSLWFPVLSL